MNIIKNKICSFGCKQDNANKDDILCLLQQFHTITSFLMYMCLVWVDHHETIWKLYNLTDCEKIMVLIILICWKGAKSVHP